MSKAPVNLVPNSIESDWHQHPNGKGWVYKTAKVFDTAYIGPNAIVYGNARVYGNAIVSGNVIVSGNAIVSGSATVSGNARVYDNAKIQGSMLIYKSKINSTPLHIIGSKYPITVDGNYVNIGCESHTVKEWLKDGLKIAQENEFTKEEIKEYKKYLKFILTFKK